MAALGVFGVSQIIQFIIQAFLSAAAIALVLAPGAAIYRQLAGVDQAEAF